MRPTAIFLSGVAASLAGAFIRSCQPDMAAKLATAWCGPATSPFGAAHHAHCIGCVIMLIGLAFVGAALIRPVAIVMRRVWK